MPLTAPSHQGSFWQEHSKTHMLPAETALLPSLFLLNPGSLVMLFPTLFLWREMRVGVLGSVGISSEDWCLPLIPFLHCRSCGPRGTVFVVLCQLEVILPFWFTFHSVLLFTQDFQAYFEAIKLENLNIDLGRGEKNWRRTEMWRRHRGIVWKDERTVLWFFILSGRMEEQGKESESECRSSLGRRPG